MAIVVACIGQPPPPPTEGQARGHLDRIVDIVAGGDLSTICELGSGTCAGDLRATDPALVPDAMPIVVGIEAIQPTRRSDGAWDSGGLLLQLCGIDGAGTPYFSEMLVFDAGSGDLRAINTLYWLGMRIARGSTTVGAGAPPPTCPA